MAAGLDNRVGKPRQLTLLELAVNDAAQDGSPTRGAKVHGKEICSFHVW